MKKPICHMFMKAFLDANQIALSNAPGELPEFQSSHEFMLELLEKYATSGEGIFDVNVEVWDCNAFMTFEDDRCYLKSNPETLRCNFTISSKKTPKKKMFRSKWVSDLKEG